MHPVGCTFTVALLYSFRAVKMRKNNFYYCAKVAAEINARQMQNVTCFCMGFIFSASKFGAMKL
jgi:hypothetical protein